MGYGVKEYTTLYMLNELSPSKFEHGTPEELVVLAKGNLMLESWLCARRRGGGGLRIWGRRLSAAAGLAPARSPSLALCFNAKAKHLPRTIDENISRL